MYYSSNMYSPSTTITSPVRSYTRILMSWACDDLSPVIDCMYHAIAGKYPQTRYYPGKESRYFMLPVGYMPTCIADLLLRHNCPVIDALHAEKWGNYKTNALDKYFVRNIPGFLEENNNDVHKTHCVT
jgi:hypothetical protein